MCVLRWKELGVGWGGVERQGERVRPQFLQYNFRKF